MINAQQNRPGAERSQKEFASWRRQISHLARWLAVCAVFGVAASFVAGVFA